MRVLEISQSTLMKLIARDSNHEGITTAAELVNGPRTRRSSQSFATGVDYKRSVILLLSAVDGADLDNVLSRPQTKTLVLLQVERNDLAVTARSYCLDRISRLSVNNRIDSFVSDLVCGRFGNVNLHCVYLRGADANFQRRDSRSIELRYLERERHARGDGPQILSSRKQCTNNRQSQE